MVTASYIASNPHLLFSSRVQNTKSLGYNNQSLIGSHTICAKVHDLEWSKCVSQKVTVAQHSAHVCRSNLLVTVLRKAGIEKHYICYKNFVFQYAKQRGGGKEW